MENTTTPPPLLSPAVENAVEKIIRETFMSVVRAAPAIPDKFGSGFAWAPNEHDISRAIAAALTKAGHVCHHKHFTNTGQCARCGRDMIPDLRALPDLDPVQQVLIETMANQEPEPRELSRHIGRVAFRRLQTLRIRRNTVTAKLKEPGATNFDRAEQAALNFAIDHISAHYKQGPGE